MQIQIQSMWTFWLTRTLFISPEVEVNRALLCMCICLCMRVPVCVSACMCVCAHRQLFWQSNPLDSSERTELGTFNAVNLQNEIAQRERALSNSPKQTITMKLLGKKITLESDES